MLAVTTDKGGGGHPRNIAPPNQPNVYTFLLVVTTTVINNTIRNEHIQFFLINVTFGCCAMPT